VLQFFPGSRFFLLNHDLFFFPRFSPPQTKKNPKTRSRGELLKLQGDFHGAIEDFNVALRLEPQNTMALSSRGDCKRMLDDCDGAMADL